jgi:hypothetical protein
MGSRSTYRNAFDIRVIIGGHWYRDQASKAEERGNGRKAHVVLGPNWRGGSCFKDRPGVGLRGIRCRQDPRTQVIEEEKKAENGELKE